MYVLIAADDVNVSMTSTYDQKSSRERTLNKYDRRSDSDSDEFDMWDVPLAEALRKRKHNDTIDV